MSLSSGPAYRVHSDADKGCAKVEVTAVSKVYEAPGRPPVHALDNVSLEVYEREFVSILGPSGCGKTTLLHMIAGFVAPSSGTVRYQGKPVTGPSPARTIVFQNYSLFQWMTAKDNVAFGLAAKGLGRAECDAKADRLLELVGLLDFRNSYPQHLSGGMQQRVALARALAPDPEVVLLDEPFAALDLLTREVMQEEMLNLKHKSGKSFVLITHSVEEAVFLGDRVHLMSGRPGRIREDIPIEISGQRTSNTRTESKEFLHYREYLSNALRHELKVSTGNSN